MLNNDHIQKQKEIKLKSPNFSRKPIDINELKCFVDSFDPYAPITNQDKAYLASLGIYKLDDPFKVTNQLISLLEELIEKEQKTN